MQKLWDIEKKKKKRKEKEKEKEKSDAEVIYINIWLRYVVRLEGSSFVSELK